MGVRANSPAAHAEFAARVTPKTRTVGERCMVNRTCGAIASSAARLTMTAAIPHKPPQRYAMGAGMTAPLTGTGNVEMQRRRPVMLVVLDGWGWREEAADNAVRQARTPTFDRLWAQLSARLPAHLGPRRRPAARADGQFRGRPSQHRRRPRGDAGPAAHRRRDRARRDRQRARADGLIERLKARPAAPATSSGLVSPGGVHSHQDHAAALAQNPRATPACRRVVHAFTDGRDTPPRSARRRYRAAARGAAAVGADRDGQRPLLRHGPRQALGARGQGLRRDRGGRRAALPRRRRR